MLTDRTATIRASITEIIRRLQQEVAGVGGITLYMQPVQDLTFDTQVSATQYQFILNNPSFEPLSTWTPKLIEALRTDASQSVVANMPLMILAALLAVYLMLGILYESYVHPLTILSTLPSAGVGAVLALLLTDTEFSVIALIGVFLIIGIVKKNAILSLLLALPGCAVGPNYQRPRVATPAAFKESPPAGWKVASSGTSQSRGAWWTVYQDPTLNDLVEQVAINNQNLKTCGCRLSRGAGPRA